MTGIAAHHGWPDWGVARSLPHHARRSITFDRGTEFTDGPYLQAGIGAQTWFCDPRSPWQKETVENTNGRVRKWLSKDTYPLSVGDGDLKELCDRLNSTPTKMPRLQNARRGLRKKAAGAKARHSVTSASIASRASARTHTNAYLDGTVTAETRRARGAASAETNRGILCLSAKRRHMAP
jgi:hypothetical protein